VQIIVSVKTGKTDRKQIGEEPAYRAADSEGGPDGGFRTGMLHAEPARTRTHKVGLSCLDFASQLTPRCPFVHFARGQPDAPGALQITRFPE
jgi:hypothetical protein